MGYWVGSLNAVGYAAWILLGLTLVTTLVLLPQVAKSRRLMGQARNIDRFSGNLRILQVDAMPQKSHQVEVLIHPRKKGTVAESAVTRPIRTAQLLREYATARAARTQAAQQRQAAARRRTGFLATFLLAALVLVVLAFFGLLSWWAVSIPGVATGVVFVLGTKAARRGRVNDLVFLRNIRDLERQLERTPMGRAALHADRKRTSGHWAQVARESLLNDKEQALAASLNQTQAQEVNEKAQQHANRLRGEELDDLARSKTSESAMAKAEAKKPSAPVVTEKKAWKPSQIPAPTYTLRAPAPRREVQLESAETQWVAAPVPMRPKQAQQLPAGASINTEENISTPIDIDKILERRRAAGE